MNKLGVLEGLLFAVGDEGLSIDNIKSILDVSETEAKNLLSMLQKDMNLMSMDLELVI